MKNKKTLRAVTNLGGQLIKGAGKNTGKTKAEN
jgi:hypothetical protein